MKKFNEWTKAWDWAKDTNRELVPTGSAQGTDIVAEWENETSRLEVHADYSEYDAEGERNTVFCIIKCYKVVVWEDKNSDYFLEDADSKEEVMESYEWWKQHLTKTTVGIV